jgi:hypothetical protein
MLILAIVPPCTEECRLVRVIGVLIFANARTCVASVLLASGPLGHRAERFRPGSPASGSRTSCRRLSVRPSAVRSLVAGRTQAVCRPPVRRRALPRCSVFCQDGSHRRRVPPPGRARHARPDMAACDSGRRAPTIPVGRQRDQAAPGADAVNDAAVAAYRLSAQAGSPLSERKLAKRPELPGQASMVLRHWRWPSPLPAHPCTSCSGRDCRPAP